MNNQTSKVAVLISICITSLTGAFMFSAINVALPSIQRDFSADAVMLSWTVMGTWLASAVALIPMGRLGDIYGRKKIFMTGMVFFAITTLLSGLATSVHMLIIMRVFQGVASSMRVAVAMAILTSVYPAEERGKALGISAASVYIGLSSGPFFGGIITQHLGWRYIFFLTVPLTVFLFLIALWKLKGEWADAKGEKFDVPGCVLYGVSLVLFIYGASLIPNVHATWLILMGIIGMTIFVFWEKHVKIPVFNVLLFSRNRVFAFSSIATLISYASVAATAFLLSLYLQYIKGFSPQSAGFILLSQPIVQATFSPLAGKLSDKIEPGIIASIGMTITVIGLFSCLFLGYQTSLPYITGILMFLGLGLALFSSPNSNAIMGSVDKRDYGIASGMVATMRTVGMVISLAFVAVLFSILIGRAEIIPEKYPALMKSIRFAFASFSGLCAIGIFFSMVRASWKIRQ